MSKLKPCPFCGSEAADPVFIGNDNTRRRKVTIRCKAPGCTQGVTVGALRFSHEWCHAEAVEKWNSRAESDELTAAKARIAELEDYVGRFAIQAKNFPERHYQDDASPLAIRISVGDLRRAAALLNKEDS